jgi:hypothetical protein
VHRKKCVSRKEENYFFALSKYQAQLEELCSSPGVLLGRRAAEGVAVAAHLCSCSSTVMPALRDIMPHRQVITSLQPSCPRRRNTHHSPLIMAAALLPTHRFCAARVETQRGAGVGEEWRA